MGLPSIGSAIIGPLVAVVLLMLRPICGITVDPLIALPAGAIVGLLCMKKMNHFREYITYGLGKMMPVAILLIGTGTISGIVKTSQFQTDMTMVLNAEPSGLSAGSDFRNCNGRSNRFFLCRSNDRISYFW